MKGRKSSSFTVNNKDNWKKDAMILTLDRPNVIFLTIKALSVYNIMLLSKKEK